MLLIYVYICYLFLCGEARSHPNIIVIVADDLGWNDVGFHGSNQIPTPNIDALAYSGIIINNYYTLPLCTPSRSALMTGRHPIKTGMQHHVIVANEPWGLGLEEKLLPEYLKELGYSTHAVGKWHLGFFKKEYTPLYRGFDSHFGYWSSHQDYYDHTLLEDYWGFDLRDGMNTSQKGTGNYTTTLLTEEAVSLIANHDTSNPFFLYMSHLAVHTGNLYHPLQAPEEVLNLYQHIKDPERRTFAGMLSMLDWSVGALVAALGSRGILENSIIVFTTDNGGAAGGYDKSAASNWPLRGVKDTVWEGGVRGVAFVWSPLLGKTPRVSQQLSHIQDWLPTILGAINATHVTSKVQFDGENIWRALSNPKHKTYDDLIITIDDIKGYYALRSGKWKLLKGSTENGSYDHVFGPTGRKREYDLKAVQSSVVARTIAHTSCPLPSIIMIKKMRSQATLSCKKSISEYSCKAAEGEICLFDVEADPCESRNLANKHKLVLSSLLLKLEAYNATAVIPRNQPADSKSNPKYWNYKWINWMDYPTPPSHLDIDDTLQSRLV